MACYFYVGFVSPTISLHIFHESKDRLCSKVSESTVCSMEHSSFQMAIINKILHFTKKDLFSLSRM